jgi:hypothetical protein
MYTVLLNTQNIQNQLCFYTLGMNNPEVEFKDNYNS